MGEGPITNPDSAFGYTTVEQTSGRAQRPHKASGVVTIGDVLVWDSQATDDEPTVHSADVSADDPALIAGVALTAAAAAGDIVEVSRGGPTLVNIGTGTVAAAELASFHATVDGAADGTAADATAIVGDYFGVFLGAEIGTTNQAVVDVNLG